MNNIISKGVIAVVLVAFLNALMGVWSRLLAISFELFQQVAARAIVGGLLGLLFYYTKLKIDFKDKTIYRDLLILILRSIALLVGISLFTYSINNGNFANINLIFALPTTAILGTILLKEKMTLIKGASVFLGFLGVALITVKDFSNLGSVEAAEFIAFISAFFYSLAYIMRKWIKNLNNEQVAAFGSLSTGLGAFLMSIIAGNPLYNFTNPGIPTILVILLAALTFISLGYLNSYAFIVLEAIVANNLLTLSALFGLLISIILYKEIPTLAAVIGGIFVVSSALLTNSELKNVKPRS